MSLPESASARFLCKLALFQANEWEPSQPAQTIDPQIEQLFRANKIHVKGWVGDVPIVAGYVYAENGVPMEISGILYLNLVENRPKSVGNLTIQMQSKEELDQDAGLILRVVDSSTSKTLLVAVAEGGEEQKLKRALASLEERKKSRFWHALLRYRQR